MAFLLRPINMPDLIKNLLQSTQTSVPDNPAEVLNDFASGVEDVAVADAISTPNHLHSGTYVYNDASSMYGKAQYG